VIRDILPGKHQAEDNAQEQPRQKRNDQQSDEPAVTAPADRLPPHVALGKNALKRGGGGIRRQWSPAMSAEVRARGISLEARNADLQLLRLWVGRLCCSVGRFHIERKTQPHGPTTGFDGGSACKFSRIIRKVQAGPGWLKCLVRLCRQRMSVIVDQLDYIPRLRKTLNILRVKHAVQIRPA